MEDTTQKTTEDLTLNQPFPAENLNVTGPESDVAQVVMSGDPVPTVEVEQSKVDPVAPSLEPEIVPESVAEKEEVYPEVEQTATEVDTEERYVPDVYGKIYQGKKLVSARWGQVFTDRLIITDSEGVTYTLHGKELDNFLA